MEIDDLSEAEDDLSEEDKIVEQPIKGLSGYIWLKNT